MKPIIVRGGGDLATGTILRLANAGYPVIVLECGRPTAIRREAAFSEAVFFGTKTVEGMSCTRVNDLDGAREIVSPGHPVIMIDETGESILKLKPDVLIDAVIAKRNIGTTIDMAGLVVALGPGFTAGEDCHYVVETKRGHNLGRIYDKGSAIPNTGIPGIIEGYGKERVIHAPASGILHNASNIGDVVTKGQLIAEIVEGETVTPVPATLSGVLRGILPDGFDVPKGMKMADIDPRISEQKNCYTVSDKARCIAGSVLELVCRYEKEHLS